MQRRPVVGFLPDAGNRRGAGQLASGPDWSSFHDDLLPRRYAYALPQSEHQSGCVHQFVLDSATLLGGGTPRRNDALDLPVHGPHDRDGWNLGTYSAHGRSVWPPRSAVNPALMPPRTTGKSARSRCQLPPALSLVDAAHLVVPGGSGVPDASRSDGVAALDVADAAWKMSGRGSIRLCRSQPGRH
jgi:hypothetical protein